MRTLYATMVRSGRTTFFIEIKETKYGTKFCHISESTLDSKNKRQRTSIKVYGDTVREFRKALDEAANAME